MENSKNQQNGLPQDLAYLSSEVLELAQGLHRTYYSIEPTRQFRDALYARLLAEARRLKAKASPAPAAHPSLARLAAVGAATLSVAGAGVALVMWRNRIAALIHDHAYVPLRTAQGR